MKLSIITCTWNSEPFVADSIASVSAQEYPHVERIFVDGGSTDGTLERLRAVPGEVRVLEGVRGGIARAMNEGVRVATGDVIAHLHSDDIYSGPKVLSLVVERMRGSKAEWLYGRCRSLIDGHLADNDFDTVPYSWRALVRRNLVPHPATFVRRDAFLEVGGFDPSWRYAMDYDMWLRLGRRGDPVQVRDYLAAFRFHPGSLSTRNAWGAHREDLRVRLEHAGRNPVALAEHLLRFGVRSWRMLRRPPPYSEGTVGRT
ncbi:MAG: glycosyltransferase family 2 protein [Hyphomicrobiaceae bacterium]|nr:glycosyltransferase family 2 protein [Hyphomicrobiaceae bacterium]